MAAINGVSSGAAISVMAQSPVAQDSALVQASHYLAVAFGGLGFTLRTPRSPRTQPTSAHTPSSIATAKCRTSTP